jgi:hypothetical protein
VQTPDLPYGNFLTWKHGTKRATSIINDSPTVGLSFMIDVARFVLRGPLPQTEMVNEITYCNKGNRWLMYFHIVSLTVTSCSCNASPNTDEKRGIGFLPHILPQGELAADVHSS